MVSHASHPVAEHISGNIFRIYFNSRNKHQQSQIGFVIIDIEKPGVLLETSENPVLAVGSNGCFDDSGVQVCSIEKSASGDTYLYYLGWNLGVTVPFRNSVGLAVRHNGDSKFHKLSAAPIMDRSKEDPFTLSYPWVVREAKSNVWKMWYGSHTSWATEKFPMRHVIKYAESEDGICWKRYPEEAIAPNEINGEFAVSRPTVIKLNNEYRMWFSCRFEQYRLDEATSMDGRHWQRCNIPILSSSETGWDSESIEYCSVFVHDEKQYMLYNGNNYGKTGFGLALWEH